MCNWIAQPQNSLKLGTRVCVACSAKQRLAGKGLHTAGAHSAAPRRCRLHNHNNLRPLSVSSCSFAVAILVCLILREPLGQAKLSRCLGAALPA